MQCKLEKWLPVLGFEGRYEVSDLGRVKSLKREVPNSFKGTTRLVKETILKQKLKKKQGYKVVKLYLGGGISKMKHVHRLVAEAFISPIPKELVVNHIDGEKANNVLSNLEIVSFSENNKHAYDVLGKKPNPPVGEKHFKSNLTEEEVLYIKNKYVKYESNSELYAEFADRISLSGFRKICYGTSWLHI